MMEIDESNSRPINSQKLKQINPSCMEEDKEEIKSLSLIEKYKKTGRIGANVTKLDFKSAYGEFK